MYWVLKKMRIDCRAGFDTASWDAMVPAMDDTTEYSVKLPIVVLPISSSLTIYYKAFCPEISILPCRLVAHIRQRHNPFITASFGLSEVGIELLSADTLNGAGTLEILTLHLPSFSHR